MDQIKDTMGPTAAAAIQEMLERGHQDGTSGWATAIGIAVLLFGASGVFAQLQDALNTIWRVEPKPGRGMWGIIRDRFLSFTAVIGTAFLLLVSLVVSATLAALGKFLTPEALPGGTYFWQFLNNVITFGFITLLFALIYRVLPDVRIGWRNVWTGAVITALLFTIGKYVLGLYLGRSSVASAFGAAGSLVVILVWVYYSSQILLLGAEFTRITVQRNGEPIVATENARPIPGTRGVLPAGSRTAAAGSARG